MVVKTGVLEATCVVLHLYLAEFLHAATEKVFAVQPQS
jgi:hypothetical protein